MGFCGNRSSRAKNAENEKHENIWPISPPLTSSLHLSPPHTSVFRPPAKNSFHLSAALLILTFFYNNFLPSSLFFFSSSLDFFQTFFLNIFVLQILYFERRKVLSLNFSSSYFHSSLFNILNPFLPIDYIPLFLSCLFHVSLHLRAIHLFPRSPPSPFF